MAGIGEALAARLAKGGETVRFVGPDNADDTGDPPRVAWVPVGARRQSARRTGGGPRDEGAIATRQWAIAIEVWGADLAHAETLVDQFLGVLHELGSHHTFPPDGEEVWDTGGVTARGATCRLTIFINAPVRRLSQPTRHVTPAATYKINDTEV